MGNREDLVLTVDDDMLEKCASNVAQAVLIEEEMAALAAKMEDLDENEKKLLKVLEEEKEKEQEEKDNAAPTNEEDKPTEPPKKKKKKSKEKAKEVVVEESTELPPAKIVDSRLLELQKSKLTTLLTLQSLALQLPPFRDNTDNLLRQLQYLRSDTATDKVVCDVSGNFMSSRDADERIAAHYAGKQYVGWKLVRDKLKELQKKGAGSSVRGGMGGDPRRGGGYGGGGQRDDRGGYGRGPPRDDRGGYGGGYRDDRGGYGRDSRAGGGGGYGDRGYGRNERDRWQRDRYDDRRGR